MGEERERERERSKRGEWKRDRQARRDGKRSRHALTQLRVVSTFCASSLSASVQ